VAADFVHLHVRSDNPTAPTSPDMFDGESPSVRREIVSPTLSALPEEKARVIDLRSVHGLRQNQVGAELGLTSSRRIRQIETSAKATLKHLHEVT
jgi:DNA-directed RNA polymerase specialized sigma subunit